MDFKQALKDKWYGQGFNAAPLLIGSAAGDSSLMKNYFGISYKYFLYIFKEDYGDMHYYAKDLEDMGKVFEKKLEDDKDFFIKVKKDYDKDMEKSEEFYQKFNETDIKKLSDDELKQLLKKIQTLLDTSVGISHAIEPFVLTTDIKIKEELGRYIKDKKELNPIFSLLMSPVEDSFVNQFENKIRQISNVCSCCEGERDALINEVIKDFFWIRNGYAGRYKLTKKDILKEMKSAKEKQIDFNQIQEDKDKIIKELELPKELIIKIKATELLTTWQDQRKSHILKAVDYMERVLEEFAGRLKFDIKYLRYILPSEVDACNLNDKEYQQELILRRSGNVGLFDEGKFSILTGKQYQDFVKDFEKEKNSEIKELTGMTASTGTVIGHVKVCTNKNSLNKVNQGDILVASMTRPEYLPAMRKASAIITDEGGITCHAAIISRELGIPCIIGTKIATKALKDGDVVEIKGNHGLVIVLERN